MAETVPRPKDIMRAFMDDAWTKREPDACARHLPADFIHFLPGNAEPQIGPEAYQVIVREFLRGFPDLTMTIEDVFDEGDRVCILWRARGTHLGQFGETAATGRSINLRGCGVARVRDGRLAQSISIFDNLEFAMQITMK